MSVRTRATTWAIGLAALLVLVIVVSAGIGAVTIPPRTVVTILVDAVPIPVGVSVRSSTILPLVGSVPTPSIEFVSPFDFTVPRTARIIVLSVRLPRILLAALVGFALATAGTVMQGFFRNPMADPSIVGVSSGAAVGAVSTIVLPLSIPFGLEGAAFVSAVVTAFVVYLLATENGRTPVATLLLAGVAIQTFLGAVISFLLLQSGESLRQVVFWLMGHLAGATWDEVGMLSLVLPLPFLLLLVHARDLNVLLLGEDDAHALGIEVERAKQLLLATASVVTAAAVAVSGVIGFVGLVVPHMLRLVVGPDHRILLPASALAGASFLVATDTIARSGAAEIPVGVVTAAVGAPFFLYLLRTREVHSP
ncbi:vitamin B12 ABC transporter permease BtuC [Haloferax mediterranei ATCC 33500]|uniref:ABC-type Fe(III)-siderophore transport system, permease component n=1 Tax=Haloferax mediterranei (strain ATCC 33500 / DSM 1411 / JCM 8866 / NBRC 14739 / NCIMB 2177 / R-4) TaxID=523841 RepID=I3R3M5_HALMT|nr:vitamin B12 ABC transporter permease BtuC [Haloferax mediterranei]AFK18835.1 ABC-type Fe(III)-siderophore transport system, permease component [Haloferax mediterranei ATCC 33500]AHZ21799.1 iron ABC transporter [Haloferax mediterranei ATCC 33500]EMA03306.1 corrinoid ABC transporter permease [Haloferax mediterranei ATCC 33500]MDX5988929.1 vitamin B12 ABC transporter permease BtuC [Haloferax mediterranei ATCC 33500]QCQ75325.1 vitamin B12 ABC transporter permease BtuC [Haloferax mediterranei AT